MRNTFLTYKETYIINVNVLFHCYSFRQPLEKSHRQFYSIQSATVYSIRKIRICLIDEINILIYVYTSVDMIDTR